MLACSTILDVSYHTLRSYRMAGSATDIIAPCVTTPNIQSIKECLQRCERQFVVDNDRGPTSEEQWTQVTKHKPRLVTRWKGKGRKELSFSDNQAFVQGIYVVAIALRYVVAFWPLYVNLSEHSAYCGAAFASILQLCIPCRLNRNKQKPRRNIQHTFLLCTLLCYNS